MTALTGEELLAWLERTTSGWRDLLSAHPEVLDLPCDVRETSSVAQLLQHIVAVELRYAQRLWGEEESSYETIPLRPSNDLYRSHERAMALVDRALADSGTDWEEMLEFTTRSSGILKATRRTILVHLAMHSIRHYAQLATLVRQHGIKPDWQMDYLLMGTKLS